MFTLAQAADLFIIGEPLPLSDLWKRDDMRRKFWWLSFDCFGPEYRDGIDSEGNPIIRQHERETDDDYERRVENSTPYCYVGPILRQYSNFVFRKEPALNANTDKFKAFNLNVDNLGTDAISYWQDLLLESQVARESYNFIDTNNTTGVDSMTRVQADSAGIRVFWRNIKSSQVLFQRDFMGKMIEAAILMQLETGDWIVWMGNNVDHRIIQLEIDPSLKMQTLESYRVASIGPVVKHGFIALPLVRLRPKFGSVSQAAPLAELQKKTTRLLTLVDEELLDSTFSQAVVSGQSGPNTSGDETTGEQEINFGNKRIMFLTNPQATYNTVGADKNQADSIRESIADTVDQIFKTAGIAPDSLQDTGQVESGLAKQFKFNDLSANLAALAKATQEAHRQSEIITLAAMNITDEQEAPVMYDTDFTLPNFEQELVDTISTINSGLPPQIVKIIAKRFADRNLALSEDEQTILDAELDSGRRFGQPSITTGSTDAS